MKAAKNTLIVALAFIIIGLFISLGGLIAMDFKFTELNTADFVTNTYSVSEEFTNISVKSAECNVRLLFSDDDSCKVVCNERDNITHSVTVENGTLIIDRTDKRKWYEHIGIFFGKMEIIVYLPKTEYESLYVSTVSGDIEVSDDFTFAEADIHNTSGDVNFSAFVNKDLSVKTVSGKIKVNDIQCESVTLQSTSGDVDLSVSVNEELYVKTVSGSIKLTDIQCKNVTAQSTSGGIIFSKVTASGNIHIESTSGKVELLTCDADSLWIKTVSGDVYGRLLTDKIFITNTVSGSIDVPRSTSGGKCEVNTTSGSIKFDIE